MLAKQLGNRCKQCLICLQDAKVYGRFGSSRNACKKLGAREGREIRNCATLLQVLVPSTVWSVCPRPSPTKNC